MRVQGLWAFGASVSMCLVLAACGGGGSADGGSTSTSTTTGSTSGSSSSSSSSSSSGGSSSTVWQASLSDSFELQLTGTLDTSVAATIYDIDLFDNSAATIASLKQNGRKVVCYFSAGSGENWRSDYSQFAAADLGNDLSGWAGEKWLDTRSANVRKIMAARMDLAVSKGCDGVDPDNVDGYTNATGFALTAATQLDYNRYLATAAHARGLAIGLKNDVDQLSDLAASYEFAINEQCHQYSECAGYSAFTSLNKPVLNVEYNSTYVNNTNGAYDALCTSAAQEKLYTVVMALKLDGSYRKSCK